MSNLEPCPFCGAGTFEIRPNGRMWLGMKYSEPTSVSVLHWCEATPGQPSRVIERVGRDEASAIEAWNRRAQPEQAVLAKRVPMTDEQITHAMRDSDPRTLTGNLFFDGIRAAERHHGIVGKEGA